MAEFMITRTQRDWQGNAGLIESHGSYSTLAEAQGYAVAVGRRYFPTGRMYWREFSATTWGLMCGQLYTFVLVSAVAASEGEATDA